MGVQPLDSWKEERCSINSDACLFFFFSFETIKEIKWSSVIFVDLKNNLLLTSIVLLSPKIRCFWGRSLKSQIKNVNYNLSRLFFFKLYLFVYGVCVCVHTHVQTCDHT